MKLVKEEPADSLPTSNYGSFDLLGSEARNPVLPAVSLPLDANPGPLKSVSLSFEELNDAEAKQGDDLKAKVNTLLVLLKANLRVLKEELKQDRRRANQPRKRLIKTILAEQQESKAQGSSRSKKSCCRCLSTSWSLLQNAAVIGLLQNLSLHYRCHKKMKTTEIEVRASFACRISRLHVKGVSSMWRLYKNSCSNDVNASRTR
ncbi:hypothetical protein HPB51_017695 [Rhipicephalus microplus]|uniref:Uncharacterized protein n=1 Tax=Rhipicephalus microplus TaxID=6941 RepID=A0A9J6E349_RHIMP|nr:hypothetical protein HPB51_017695 [Rhipicephalus microplus]